MGGVLVWVGGSGVDFVELDCGVWWVGGGFGLGFSLRWWLGCLMLLF